jgi:hypothetical protein
MKEEKPMALQRGMFGGCLLAIALACLASDAPCREDEPACALVDARTLGRKVLCGYQGWFACPGDDLKAGWVHWSRDRTRLTPDTLTFEMWPDMSEYSDAEKYPAPGFTHPDGKPAYLFSSAHPRTVDRHFDWMKQYGIDGVLAQRFLGGLEKPAEAPQTRILNHVRAAANRTGRVFAVEYDMTGTPSEKLYDLVVNDWKWLVDEMKITEDARYLHHDGKPVLAVYGFFSDRFEPKLAHRLIDFFKNDKKYRACLIGSGQWSWRTEKNAEWARAFRRFDVYIPWNVGNVKKENGKLHAATETWAQDLAEARRVGMQFMPVIYPGFSWDNLMRKKPGATTIPRLGGDFYWAQFSAAATLGVDMAKVAMFDEVDEGTAIFKVSNTPPREGHFVTLDGRPTDWYLRLTGKGSRLFRREIANRKTIPIKP